MHVIQKKILSLAQLEDINEFSYRQLAERTGCEYAAQARHHLQQLVKLGYFRRNDDDKLALVGDKLDAGQNKLIMIPVLGEADCGEATRLASDEIRGYLSVSPNAIPCKSTHNLFALKACGNSMNKAHIRGKTIEDADYVIIKKCSALDIENGDYVVSILNGLANIKKFHRDDHHRRIILVSESYQEYPPIVIAEEDLEYYQPLGKVVDVVKGTSHLA